MKFEFRERDRRAVLLLVCASVLYVFVSQVALPAFDRLNAASSSAGEKEAVLAKYRRALVRKGRYVQLLEQARKNVNEAESKLISGANQSLASVELQTIVEEAARNAGIALTQRTIAPAKKKDEFFNEIRMAAAFDSTPNQLTTFLAALRNASRFVAVSDIQVAPTQVVHESPKSGEFQKLVRVNLNLVAILSSTPASTPAAEPKKG